MDLITLDFETYYDREYSLSKMTTEEYIRDPRFQVIGVSTMVNDEEPVWVTGPASVVLAHLNSLPWENAMLLCQNTMFDGAILTWKCGIRPKAMADTMLMSRAIYGVEVSHSLKAIAERLGIGQKGTEVLNALGKRRTDFTEDQLAAYGGYCVNDVSLTHHSFHRFMGMGFPKGELKLIDLTLRMFTDPVLELDRAHLEAHLKNVTERKGKLLEDAGVTDKKDLMSNPKFAELLRGFGVEPPMKVSPTTGKETYAFAKGDEAFVALSEHDDDRVQSLVAARLGSKSTLEETRTQRFIDISKRGSLPVPIRYYAAHTGRWGGSDKINLQNLPSRGPNAKQIKNSIVAPAGYVLIDADSAQIEARVLAWLAEQDDVVETFANNGDVYRMMASKIYGKAIEDISKAERQIGKVAVLGCFGADTEVLTDRGWVRIVEVLGTDKVWDGVEWVTHRGVLDQGVKEVLTHNGVSATSDHEILTEHGWQEWSAVCANPHHFQSALRAATLPCWTGSLAPLPEAALSDGNHGADAPVGGKGSCTEITLFAGTALDVTPAQRSPQTANGIGNTAKYTQMMRAVYAYLTGCLRASLGAIIQQMPPTVTMGAGVSLCIPSGERIVPASFCMCPPYPATTTRRLNSTASKTLRGTFREISALWIAKLTSETAVRFRRCKPASMPLKQKMPTYDLAFAGPRNRYAIKTAAGPMLVHNCGYGVGHHKLQMFLKMQAGVEVDLDEAKRIIDIYRGSNYKIAKLWKDADTAIRMMNQGNSVQFGRPGVLEVDASRSAIKLPSGLYIQYPDLKGEQGERGIEYSYKVRTGRKHLYGGLVVENACQSIARCIIGEQMLKIAKRYRVVLTVHDSVVACVREAEAVEAQAYIEECMRWTPDWAEGLPVNCESEVGRKYGG